MSKKSSRLSDTAAVVGVPEFGPERNESHSVSVRKIDNGYIVSKSSCSNGRYESSEEYAATPPQLAGKEQSNAMAKALDYMKREGSI